MADEHSDLIPVTADDLKRDLAYALVHDGRKMFRRADDLMARITAEHLVRYLEMCGLIVMRRREPSQTGAGHVLSGPE